MLTRLFKSKFITNNPVLKRKLSHIHTDTKKLEPDLKTSNPKTDEKYDMILADLEEIKEDLSIIKYFGGMAWIIGCIILYKSGDKKHPGRI